MTPTPQADLFGGALPPPPAASPFFAFHRESQDRERKAGKRGDCRGVGAERRARRDFTLRCLNPQGT